MNTCPDKKNMASQRIGFDTVIKTAKPSIRQFCFITMSSKKPQISDVFGVLSSSTRLVFQFNYGNYRPRITDY